MNQNMLFKKLSVVGLLAVAAFGFTANAATADELQAQITALLAQIAQLQGGSTSSIGCYAFTRDLTDGVSGADVSALQSYLAGKGMFSVAPTGYFGPITKAAVASWQAANGVAPAVGYFGAISRAKYASVCGAVVVGDDDTSTGDDDDDTNGDLEGGAGSITVTDLSKYSGESVGEGDEDVEILAFEVEADDESDVEISSLKVEFVQGTAADSEDLTDYAESVSVWFGGDMVGDADTEDFSENNDIYTKSISLDGAIVRAGETEEFVIAVTAQGSLDSGDIDTDAWVVDVLNVRFEDGEGVVTTESTDADALEKSFDFDSFATATGLDLTVKKSNDSVEAGVVNVDATDDTDGVELLTFTLEADGSDINLTELPITLTVTGATDVDALVNRLILTVDGEEYSETVSTSAAAATVTFDDLDIDIADGDELEFVVTADVNDIETGFDEGDTLKAELTATNRDYIEAEDQTGEDVATGDMSGTALGDEQSFYDVGVMVSFVSADESVAVDDGSDDDTGTFIIKYRVEAFDGTIYVSDSATATAVATIPDATATGGVRYLVEQSGTATIENLSALVTFSTAGGATDSGVTNGVELADGEYAEFTLTVTRTNNSETTDNGLYRAFLKAITWATTDAATQNVYDFDLTDYKTDPVSLD